LLQALAEARNNVSEAARKLGITRITMRYRMDKHHIKFLSTLNPEIKIRG
jgi:transcriptional regulator with GAF, ATPase, and Fis domain